MAVIYTADGIIVMGGFIISGTLADVMRIDVESQAINTVGQLAQATGSAAPIRVSDTIFLFGGSLSGGVYLDVLQTLVLTSSWTPTSDPTPAPTSDPSVNPTVTPTSAAVNNDSDASDATADIA